MKTRNNKGAIKVKLILIRKYVASMWKFALDLNEILTQMRKVLIIQTKLPLYNTLNSEWINWN